MPKPKAKPSRLLAVGLVLPMLAGCYRRVSYASPDGRMVEVINVGFDTQIGSRHAETPDGSVTIEGATSEAAIASKLTDLADKLVDVAASRAVP